MDPLPLMEVLLSIEKDLGRERGEEGYSDRIIDIDLLFYGDLIMEHPRLTLPHPAMARRRFVLEPLSEIASGILHPVNGMSVQKMLALCKDPSTLRRII